MVTFSSVTSPVTSSMMNRLPVMVISRMVTSPVRMTTCFMGSMPAYSPDWVMVILSVFSAWEELSEDSSELSPLSVWELLSSSEDEPEDRLLLLQSPGALLCRTCRGCACRSALPGPGSTASTTAPPRIPRPDPGRTVPFSFCHTSTSLLCPPAAPSALYAIISRRTVPAVVISSRSGLPAVFRLPENRPAPVRSQTGAGA